jgi:hypothetical protein
VSKSEKRVQQSARLVSKGEILVHVFQPFLPKIAKISQILVVIFNKN